MFFSWSTLLILTISIAYCVQLSIMSTTAVLLLVATGLSMVNAQMNETKAQDAFWLTVDVTYIYEVPSDLTTLSWCVYGWGSSIEPTAASSDHHVCPSTLLSSDRMYKTNGDVSQTCVPACPFDLNKHVIVLPCKLHRTNKTCIPHGEDEDSANALEALQLLPGPTISWVGAGNDPITADEFNAYDTLPGYPKWCVVAPTSVIIHQYTSFVSAAGSRMAMDATLPFCSRACLPAPRPTQTATPTPTATSICRRPHSRDTSIIPGTVE